jgi:acetyltransferase
MRSLDVFLNPRSIAVVGPSPHGNLGTACLENLLSMKSEGVLKADIHCVNPNYPEVLGTPCEPDLPQAELVVLIVPTSLTVDYLRMAIAKGYEGAIVISGGFGEVGGRRLKDLIPDLGGMRMLGPNTLGVVDTYSGVFTFFAPFRKGGRENLPRPKRGSLAVISQSGQLGVALYDELCSSGPGVRAIVTLGNAEDVNIAESVEYFAQDPLTSAILIYAEGSSEGRSLMDAVRRARENGKPVIFLLGGVTQVGKRATSSHTASVLSSSFVVTQALRQAGAYVVSSLEDALDAAKAAVMIKSDPGSRIAVLTNSGGQGVLAADALSSMGFTLPDLSSSQRLIALKSSGAIPPISSIANPIDVTGGAGDDGLFAAYSALMEDSSVDSVLLIPTHHALPITLGLPAKIAAARAKPTVVSELGSSELAELMRAAYDSLGLPSYPSSERAARALHAVRWLAANPGTWTVGRSARGGLEVRGELWPDLVDALASMGFDVPEWSWVGSSGDWPDDGYPAVLKVHAPSLVHKTEAGAVVVGIRDAREMDEAVRRLAPIARSASGRLYAQRMVRGVELRVGLVRDHDFGCVIDVGLGGVVTELIGDHSARVAPVTEGEALEMLSELRLRPLLEGYRGMPRADMHRLSSAIAAFSDAACSPGISELEVNPLIVDGPRIYAVDARASLFK